MKRAVVCCGIIYEDIKELLERTPYEANIIKLSPRLRNSPAELGKTLQETVDSLMGGDYEEIILTYFLCGNSLLGLTARDIPIVFAKVQDCIEACMGACEGYGRWRKCSMFQSRGWLNNDADSNDQLRAMRNRYDEEKLKELYSIMYANYENVIYMKLEETVSPKDMEKVVKFADLTGLELKVKEGSLETYRDLLALKHSDKIHILRPGERVSLSIFEGK